MGKLAMMHPYAINLGERHTVPLYLGILAFGAAWAISATMKAFAWEPPFWIELPGFFALYGAGYEVFKARLWRVGLIRWLCQIRTPYIHGQWDGVVQTSFDERAERHSVKITIVQNWTEISIQLRSAYSTSKSIIGGLTVDTEQVLTYEYFNEPLPGALPTMHAHRGTARLKIPLDASSLEGEYYSGRDRQNQGTLTLTRQVARAV